uniref:Uncharacterized protein n=1 Tax=Oryza barthii TaxID=65489 RepID=A0A0D3GB93_9ORYZ
MVADLEPRSMGMARASRRRTPAERQEVEEVGGQSRRHTTRVIYCSAPHLPVKQSAYQRSQVLLLLVLPRFPSPSAAIIQRHWLGLCYAPPPSSEYDGMLNAARNGAPQPLVTTWLKTAKRRYFVAEMIASN